MSDVERVTKESIATYSAVNMVVDGVGTEQLIAVIRARH